MNKKEIKPMISLEINEEEVRRIYVEKLEEHIKKIDKDLIFWDTSELKKRTSMSFNTMQKLFFFDQRFPKYKIGNKWYYPAEKTKEFLLMWIEEQR